MMAFESWETKQEVLSTHPCGAPVLRISVADVLFPTLTTWGQPVRKSRIQLQREVFSPTVLSLVLSFVGIKVLNSHVSVPFVHVRECSVE
jgi:hypothetical protein